VRCAMFTGDGPAAAQAAAAAVGIAEESTHWSLLPEDKLALVRSAAVLMSSSSQWQHFALNPSCASHRTVLARALACP
jgi:hypothetical protein